MALIEPGYHAGTHTDQGERHMDVNQVKSDFEAYNAAVKSRLEELKAAVANNHGAAVPADISTALEALDQEINGATLDLTAGENDTAATTDATQGQEGHEVPAQPTPTEGDLNQAPGVAGQVAAGTTAVPQVDGGAAPVGTNFAPSTTAPAEGDQPAT